MYKNVFLPDPEHRTLSTAPSIPAGLQKPICTRFRLWSFPFIKKSLAEGAADGHSSGFTGVTHPACCLKHRSAIPGLGKMGQD